MTQLTYLILAIMALITGIFLLVALSHDDDENGPKGA